MSKKVKKRATKATSVASQKKTLTRAEESQQKARRFGERLGRGVVAIGEAALNMAKRKINRVEKKAVDIKDTVQKDIETTVKKEKKAISDTGKAVKAGVEMGIVKTRNKVEFEVEKAKAFEVGLKKGLIEGPRKKPAQKKKHKRRKR